jgi:hypothetical protein
LRKQGKRAAGLVRVEEWVPAALARAVRDMIRRYVAMNGKDDGK